MPDIQTIWDVPNNRCDWQQSGVTLASGNDLASSVLISLFSDRRVSDGDIPPDGGGDPRGWWGDAQLGSRLWLLDRAKLGPKTGVLAKTYCDEALQWLIDDHVVERVSVSVNVILPSRIDIFVTLFRGSGQRISLNYAWVWKGLA